MISIQFMLRKQGKDIGQITWERETINKRGFELPVWRFALYKAR